MTIEVIRNGFLKDKELTKCLGLFLLVVGVLCLETRALCLTLTH